MPLPAVAAPLRGIWTIRLIAVGCIGIALDAVIVSLRHVRHDDTADPWLMPLALGLVVLLLGLVVGTVETSDARLGWPDFAHRAWVITLLAFYALVLLPGLGFVLGSAILVAAVALRRVTGKLKFDRLKVGLGGLALVALLWAVFASVIETPLPGPAWLQ